MTRRQLRCARGWGEAAPKGNWVRNWVCLQRYKAEYVLQMPITSQYGIGM